MRSGGKLQGVVRDRRALLQRLLVAELLSRRGEGPLAPRFVPVAALRGARGGKRR